MMPPEQPIGTPTETPPAPEGYISRAELDAILAERDRQHAEQVEAVRAQLPRALVPAHGGGPGNDNHQKSWCLAEQELAQRGESLDHWE